jgi:uncharacterized protein (DUF2236 family)
MWPADRAAFAKYWEETLAELTIDAPVREYLRALTTRENMPLPLRGSTRFNQWIATGFLPERLREEMRFEWSERDQRRFERLMRRIGAVQRKLPGVLRRFPFNWFLWDLKLRIRFDRPLV